MRRVAVEAAVVGDLLAEPREIRRDVERRRLGQPLDPGRDAEQDLVVLGAEGDLDRGVAEEVGEGPLLGRLRPDGQCRR